ncbi:SigB/SigF/SigG family RNA polymerase sigma factor [Streptomyces sp. A5-4]|uniref:SigB/SigF/SigG family RNA polymerase sigma factor n=1 Tax=Streptomyces sp. A5-4 TaxID=3384771 RepID=UPI003DA9F650
MTFRFGRSSVPGDARLVGGLPWIEEAGKVAPKDARELSKLFFDQLQVFEEGTHEYQYARDTLIEMNQSLVRFAARRFRKGGSREMEEINQVGTIGLIKAIDRFDLSREVEFSSFAIPCIVGEIKRFFRATWAVHVPRQIQELCVQLPKAREELAVALGRNCTVAELAQHLELSEQEVAEGLLASNGYTAGSLDISTAPGDDGQGNKSSRTHADTVGGCDPAMELVENVQALAPLLGALTERQRSIVEMRFGQEMTQAQIGERLGVSQMQASRLLTCILATLRAGMLTDK